MDALQARDHGQLRQMLNAVGETVKVLARAAQKQKNAGSELPTTLQRAPFGESGQWQLVPDGQGPASTNPQGTTH